MSGKQLLKTIKQYKLSLARKLIDPRDRNIILFPGASNVYQGIGTSLLCNKEAEDTLKRANIRKYGVEVKRYYHQEISENKYNQLSDETLENLSDKFDALLEDNSGADVSLSNGVLTVVVSQDCIYVINKQTPNRQLWFSSPISGPKRFCLAEDNVSWVDRQTKINLYDILSEEFSQILKRSVKLEYSKG